MSEAQDAQVEKSTPAIAVIALIKNQGGKILLQRRNDKKIPTAHGKWEFPGGGIDGLESFEQALKRECLEEIGCVINVAQRIPLDWTNIWKLINGETKTVSVICYECKILEGQPKPCSDEVAEIGWFSKEEVEKMDTLPGIKEFTQLV